MSPRAMCCRMRLDAGLVVRARQARAEDAAGASPRSAPRSRAGLGAATVSRAWTSSRRAREPATVAVQRHGRPATRGRSGDPRRRPSRGAPAGAAAAPGRPPRSTAGARATCPRSYPRNPTSPPRNGGASAGTTGVGSSRANEASGDGERIRTGGRRLEHRHGIRRQVGPARIPARAARSRAGPGPAGRGRPRRRRSDASLAIRSGRRRNRSGAVGRTGQVRADGDHAGDDTAGSASVDGRNSTTDGRTVRYPPPMRARDLGIRIGLGNARARSTPSPTSPASPSATRR